MCFSNRILYVRFLPDSFVYLIIFIAIIVYLSKYSIQLIHLSKFNFVCISLLASIWLYDQFWLNGNNLISIGGTLLRIICAAIIIVSSRNDKYHLLDLLVLTIQIIVGIAIIGWIAFLFKFPLPHYTDTSDAFYTHTIYYIFNLNGLPELQLLPRFAGPFLEPGHLGTMCIFLLYLRDFKIKNIGNLILLIAVLLSLSLAAYGLMIIAIIITLYNKRKYAACLTMFGLFGLSAMLATYYNGGDNPINQAIVARLEVNDNGEIAGNNRTSRAFDAAYEKFLKSNEILFGQGRKAYGVRGDGSDNITIGCATYKRYFFLRGIIGSSLMILFLLLYLLKFENKRSIGFFIIYIVANCIRDYPSMEMWLFTYLLGVPLIGQSHKLLNRSIH